MNVVANGGPIIENRTVSRFAFACFAMLLAFSVLINEPNFANASTQSVDFAQGEPQSHSAQLANDGTAGGSTPESSQEKDLKGFANIRETMPIYLSQTSVNGFRMDAGSRFVVVLENGIDSSSANLGDSVSAKLAETISYAGETVIPAGSMLSGSLVFVDKARSPLRADLPGKHWLNAQGGIGIRFDKLVIRNRTISLNAVPAPKAMVNAVATTTRSRLITDKNGDITVYYGSGKYTGMELGIEGASLATGPFGLLVGPALSGIAGAASPSYAEGHPDDQKGFKVRTKGFFLGMVKGLPGGGIVTGAAEHGYDVVLVPGDKIILELKEDMNI